MHRFRSYFRTSVVYLSVFVLLIALIGGLAYLASTLGGRRQETQIVAESLLVTARPAQATPLALFAPLDPAIIPYLERGQPDYGIVALQVLGASLPPVGAYLPPSGNTQFELPTPTPTPIPTATLHIVTLPPPTPRPTPIPPTITPTPSPTSELVATVLAFASLVPPPALPFSGSECAPVGLPVEGSILSQRFHGYHSGVDLVIPSGTAVYATHSGVVMWADWNPFGYGNLVIVQSSRFITYYAHNTSFNIAKGDSIGRGTIIAWSGSTGNSSGPHVHYETRIDDVPVDPLTFADRGYTGC